MQPAQNGDLSARNVGFACPGLGSENVATGVEILMLATDGFVMYIYGFKK